MARNIFLVALLALFVWICLPLSTPIAMGGVFALLFYPLQERLEKRKVPAAAAAAGLTIGFGVLVLLPVSVLLVSVVKTGLAELRVMQAQLPFAPGVEPLAREDGSWMSHLAHHPQVTEWVKALSRYFPIQAEELIATLAEVLKVVGLKVGQALGQMASRIPGMALALVVAMVSLYFFLVDARRLSTFVRRHSFFTAAQTSELMKQLGIMARSVVLASVASGGSQALVMGLAMVIVGADNALMVAFLVFLGSFVPLVGSAPVSLSVALWAWLSGRPNETVVLLVAAGVTSVIDNVVRPWVLKGGANLHPLLGFAAAFGGLQVFGLSGLFLGPMIAGLFAAVLRISSRAAV
ncbi:MAG: hypothetical protein RJB38_239 [Pseudomonadota bacterium]|jgi:predicted PurR-regulated permease PerM